MHTKPQAYIFGLFKINLNKLKANLRSVAHMKPGEFGTVVGFSDDFLSVKLMEMGCLPGAVVSFNFAAPLGDPICISVAGYELTLRMEEAATIAIQ